MKKLEINYFSMTGRVIAFCDDNPAPWQGVAAMEEQLTLLKDQYAQGEQLMNQKESANPKGQTDAKDDKFEAMRVLGFIVAKRLSGLARKKNDPELLNLVNYSESSFKRGPERQVKERCKVMADKAHALAGDAEAPGYKVTEEAATQLDTLITDYSLLPEKRDNTVTARKVTGQAIESLIDAIRQTLDGLDDLVTGLIEDEDFQDNYFEARAIHSPGYHKTKADESSAA